MATIKIASLLLKTLAKPLAARIKQSARDHPRFRETTVWIAQAAHSSEIRMRVGLLGEVGPRHVKPLNDAKAIDQGANFVAETFLFVFAASIIGAESYRSRRKEQGRRDGILDKIEALEEQLKERDTLELDIRNEISELRRYLTGLDGVLEEVIGIGLKGGWFPGASSTEWKSRDKLPPPPTNSTSSGEGEEASAPENVLDGAVLNELLRLDE